MSRFTSKTYLLSVQQRQLNRSQVVYVSPKTHSLLHAYVTYIKLPHNIIQMYTQLFKRLFSPSAAVPTIKYVLTKLNKSEGIICSCTLNQVNGSRLQKNLNRTLYDLVGVIR